MTPTGLVAGAASGKGNIRVHAVSAPSLVAKNMSGGSRGVSSLDVQPIIGILESLNPTAQ